MGINNKINRDKKKRNKICRRKELKKNKIKKDNKPLSPIFQMMPNPFEDLGDEGRKQIRQEIAQNSEKIYRESLLKIKEIIGHYDPISLLSMLASYGLTVGVGKDGIQKKDSDHEIQQSHIEICQSLMLQTKPEELQRQPFHPAIFQELWDALVKLMLVRNYMESLQGIEDKPKEEKAVMLLQWSIRANTRMVRNWGYLSQVQSISREIYGHFDGLLEKHYGFNANTIIDLFQLLIDEIETAMTNRYQLLSRLSKINDKTKLIFQYHELIGAPPIKSEEFIQGIDIKSIPHKLLFTMLLYHYDLRLHENYEFSPEHLSSKLGVDKSIIRKILENFSYEWGDLESCESDNLYLSNPIWKRPIIKIGDDKYFCVFPQVFFSFIFPSLDTLIEKIDKNALSNRRANYLEEKIVEIINRRFPESNTVSRLKWKVDETEYETDLITFIDSHAIIIEAKSGKISEPALRGAPDRLKKHIEEILIAPNIQSKRLKERLEELITNPNIVDDLRKKLPVDLNNIHKIIRVSVSLEDFGSIQANVAQLRETGWLPDDFKPCPTMNLADIETLFDFLYHPVQIVHYLERRQELEATMGYLGDELDLMGLYIGTLFNLGDIHPGMEFVISGMSSPLDTYYESRDAGIEIAKPHPIISPLFTGIMEQLEKRYTPRWTEIGVILNRFSPDDQRKLTRMIEDLKKNVRKNWMRDGHKNMVICVPPRASQYSIGYVIYNNNNANRRNEFIKKAAMSALEAEHINQCLVIAKNLDQDDLNYHFIGLME